MKTILTKFLGISSIALLMLASCKKDGTLATSNGGKAGTLSTSAATLPLDKTKINDTTKVVFFNFTAANYGFSAAVTNTLQIDAAGDNWAHPTSVTLPTKVLNIGYSTFDFNNIVLKLNLAAGVASQVMIRVAHSLSANVPAVYSNVVTMTVTPFNLTSWLYVTGAFSGWQNPGPQEDSLISVTGNGVYTGIINFTAGNNQFLILPAKNWNNKYATSQTSTPTTAVTYNASNNLNAPADAGQYIVTFDSNTGIISFTLADSYSVIGDGAQGWNAGNDVAMKFVNDGSNTWTVTTPLVSTGSIKIREDDAWTWSWGIPNSGSPGDGVPNTLNDSSNGNIPVPTSGNYNVSFIMAPTANGTTPAVTTTYTLTKQ